MSVIIQMWKRLAPSRTKKLSTSWVMILRLTGRGKVARCGLCFFFFLKFNLIMQRGLSLMFAYFIFRTKKDAVVLGLALEWLSYATSLENIE